MLRQNPILVPQCLMTSPSIKLYIFFVITMLFGWLILYSSTSPPIFKNVDLEATYSNWATITLPQSAKMAAPRKSATAKSRNRIACFIFTCPQNIERAFVIRDTWGKRCDGTFFVMEYYKNLTDVLTFLPLKGIIPGYKTLWSKTVLTFTYAFNHYLDEFEWFFKVDDDAYVIVENLKHLLSFYKPSKPFYFGKRFGVLSDYMAGGPGYVLSKEAVRRVRGAFMWNNNSCPGLEKVYYEDVLMGRCLHKVGVRCANTLDVTGKETFHNFEMRTEVLGEPPKWIYKYAFYPVQKGLNCCSDYTISFHYMKPSEIKLMDFMLYHLKVRGEREERAPDIFRYRPENDKEYRAPKKTRRERKRRRG